MMPRTVKDPNQLPTIRPEGGKNPTDLDAYQRNDNLLEAFCMPARDRLLEEL